MPEMLDFSLLKTLTQLPGVSGRERAVRDFLLTTLPIAQDDARVDALGNLIITRKGTTDKAVLLCAHMDEVGLMVQHIEPDGFLRFIAVGGIDPRTLLAQRVWVQTRQGPLLGVIGTRPAHVTTESERARAVALHDLFIDIGMSGEAARNCVQVGDVAVLERSYEEFGEEKICAKAIDDRVGVFVLAEILRHVQNPAYTVHAVFSTQEEVGGRGAMTAAYGLNADVCLCLDTTGAADIPGVSPQDYITRVGGGVGITALDARTITPQPLFEDLAALCIANRIPWQVRIAPRGGTDAGVVHVSKTGMVSCSLAVPTRNIHSNVEVISKRDVHAMFELVCKYLAGENRKGAGK